LTNYDGVATTYTASTTVDNIVSGRVYRFVSTANNAYGDSPQSLQVIAGVGNKMVAPAAPSRDLSFMSMNSI